MCAVDVVLCVCVCGSGGGGGGGGSELLPPTHQLIFPPTHCLGNSGIL